MKNLTKKKNEKDSTKKSNNKQTAQCCAKTSKVLVGCHD